jgi:hypothetical protein
MADKIVKVSSGLLAIMLFTMLVFELKDLPAGMILPGYFLGGMALIGILLGCLLVASLLRLIFKKYSFLTLYLVSTVIAFTFFYYSLYSPTLKIIVPRGYKGEVNLVLSKVQHNILAIDTNGIGYINQWTFDHTYTPPLVIDDKGTNINNLRVGFNPTAFWGKSKSCCVGGKEIETLNFEIVPKEKHGQKQYYSKELTTLVNKNLVNFVKLDNYTHIDSALFKK